MYVFLYNYVKTKFGEKVKSYYMETDSFIVYIKAVDIYSQTLQKMLKLDLILQIMNQIDHSVKEKIRN